MSQTPAGSASVDPRIQRAVAEFQKRWHEHVTKKTPRPVWHDSLPDTEPLRTGVAVKLACVDLDWRLAHGDATARVEDYLAVMPQWRDRSELLTELIESEYKRRRLRGETVQSEEYERRFPIALSTLSFKSPAGTTITPAVPGQHTPPDYVILGVLGQGGQGVVYKAEDISLKRTVALKMIASGEAAPGQLARFLVEAQAAARLRHAHIVQVYHIDQYRGQPYCVMEFVEGGSLSKRMRDVWPDVRRSADIVMKLAQGMAYAHEQKVIHRDLKPSNVLMDKNGTPKIADFGLARLLDDEQSRRTQSGDRLGTPAYMPPEQAEGNIAQMGPASDIYSLGAILFELLTGRPPFSGPGPVAIQEVMRRVLHDDVLPPRRLNPEVPRDLETICLKCLEKNPAKRYASSALLAEDLRRYQSGEPIQARPAGRVERTVKWVKRRPALASLLLLVALLLIIAPLVGSLLYWNEVRHGQNLQKALDDKETQRQLARRNLFGAHLNIASKEWQRSNVGVVRETLKRHRPLPSEDDLRGFEWRHLWGLTEQSLMTIESPRELAASIAFSPDGTTLAVAAQTPDKLAADILLWDAATGQLRDMLTGHTGHITALVFTPDGQLLSASRDETVRLWDMATRKTKSILRGRIGEVQALALAPDGSYVVCGGGAPARRVQGECPGRIVLWDYKRDAEIGAYDIPARGKHGVRRLSLSPAGTLLAIGDDVGSVSIWDVASRRAIHRLDAHLGIITGLAFSPDGQTLATVGGAVSFGPNFLSLQRLEFADDGRHTSTHTYGGDYRDRAKGTRLQGEAKLWRIARPDDVRLHATLLPVSGRVTALAFSPDGRSLAIGDSDRTIKMMDPWTAIEQGVLRGHSQGIMGLAYSPAGGVLVSVSDDRLLQCWDVRGVHRPELPGTWEKEVSSLSLSADSSLLATGESGGSGVRLWDAATRRHLALLAKEPGTEYTVAFCRKNKNLLAIGTRKLVKARPPGDVSLWDAEKRQHLVHLGQLNLGVALLDFTPDGQHVVAVDEGGWAKVWHVEKHMEIAHVQVTREWARVLSMAADGASFGVRDIDERVNLWTLPDLKRLVPIEDARSLAFAPDGKSAASFNRNGELTLWSWPERTKKASKTLTAPGVAPRLQYMPDSKTLVAYLVPIRFLDPVTGEERFTIEEADNNFNNLVISPDGSVMAAGKNKAMLWYAPKVSDAPRSLREHQAKLRHAQPPQPQDACRTQLPDWLAHNLNPDPDTPILADFEKTLGRGSDFEIALGPSLTRPSKAYILRTTRGRFFAFELSPVQFASLRMKDNEANAHGVSFNAEPAEGPALVRLEFPSVTRKNADAVEIEVSMSPFAPQADRPLFLRRTLALPLGKNTTATHALAKVLDNGRLPSRMAFTAKSPGLTDSTPLMAFLEVCEDRGDGKLVRVSNIVGALFDSSPRPVPKEAANLVIGRPEKGSLAATEPNKEYEVELKADRHYLIDLTAKFDPVLKLRDASGLPLFENDDLGLPSNLNARLVFTPTRDETIRVQVASAQKGAGEFTLLVREALPVGEPVVIVEKLTDADGKIKDKFHKKHRMTLLKDSPYTIELISRDFDTHLLLGDPAAKKVLTENDDALSGDTTRSRIDFTPQIEREYEIIVTSFEPGGTGRYTLRVQRYKAKPD